MRKLLMWFLLLNKRLYKKFTFIVILLLIPLMVLAMGIIAREDSGFISIALAQSDPEDAISSAITEELIGESRLIRFTEYDSPTEATRAVSTGLADSAWIFPEDMQGRIDKFTDSRLDSDYIVTVIEREQTVPLRLSHEKLSGVVYKYCSETLYFRFIRENVSQLDELSDEQLKQYYDDFIMDGELFAFAYPDSNRSAEGAEEVGYLLAPMRGMLAVLVVLCGLSAALFCLHDERQGTFAWMPQSKRPLQAFACQLIAILNVSVVMLISLTAIGLTVSLAREILMLMLFALCCTVFCMVMSELFHSIKILGSITPLAVVVMIAVCPVFFDLKGLRILQYLFPPTYYINSAYSDKFLLYSVFYCLIGTLIYMGFRKIFRRN